MTLGGPQWRIVEIIMWGLLYANDQNLGKSLGICEWLSQHILKQERWGQRDENAHFPKVTYHWRGRGAAVKFSLAISSRRSHMGFESPAEKHLLMLEMEYFILP